MSQADDKRELLKLKQGLIEDSESIKEEKPEQIKLKGWKWWENYFYHNKMFIIFGVFIVAIVTFLVYTTVTREGMDIRVVLAAGNGENVVAVNYKSEAIEKALEMFCPDYNKDSNVHVETFLTLLTDTGDSQYYMASQAKIFGEFSRGVAQIYIGDSALFDEIIGEEKNTTYFTDLSELYPDNDSIDGIFYKIKGSPLAAAANWEASCPDDLYLVIRNSYKGMTSDEKTMAEERAKALEVFDNIINNRIINVPSSD